MAKYQKALTGNFDEFLRAIDSGILRGSISASYEDGSDYECNGVRCAVRVYERYSMMGSNRVSLNVTLLGAEQPVSHAITSAAARPCSLSEHRGRGKLCPLCGRYRRALYP